ncbi:hypothetical protein HI914_04416 [Erysiphe necator]|nr:hypothetical protein HI914_04416 [Erysiphe necator]
MHFFELVNRSRYRLYPIGTSVRSAVHHRLKQDRSFFPLYVAVQAGRHLLSGLQRWPITVIC